MREDDEDPLSPKGGNCAPRHRRKTGSTYRAHEAAADEARSRAMEQKAREVLEEAKRREELRDTPPPMDVQAALDAAAARRKSVPNPAESESPTPREGATP